MIGHLRRVHPTKAITGSTAVLLVGWLAIEMTHAPSTSVLAFLAIEAMHLTGWAIQEIPAALEVE